MAAVEVCGNFVVNHRLFRLFAYLPRDRADGGDKISLRASIRGEPVSHLLTTMKHKNKHFIYLEI